MTRSEVNQLLRRCRSVDAFVGPRAKGNPAGVVLLSAFPDAATMIAVASASGHSETAFVVPKGAGSYRLRWFSPRREIPLCGHATLATAWILWTREGAEADSLTFETLSGALSARRVGTFVELDFPEDPPEPWTAPAGLVSSLGLKGTVKAAASPTTGKVLLEVPLEESVRGLRPDIPALTRVRPDAKSGVVVTARARAPYDFVSRYFNPWAGVDEDPVTGAAHCLLAPYWSPILRKDQFLAFQASARGGVLEVQRSRGRVLLRGQARLGPARGRARRTAP